LNDFGEWVKENRTVFIAAAALLLVAAVVTGTLIGTAQQRNSVGSSGRETDMSAQALDRIRRPELLLPAPIVPSLHDDSVYSFYFYRYYDIEDQTLLHLPASQLLSNLPEYETGDIRPFSVRGMEFEVLTLSDELAEQ